MLKYEHEFRDPIHVFVRLDSDERRVVDSMAFQRLGDFGDTLLNRVPDG